MTADVPASAPPAPLPAGPEFLREARDIEIEAFGRRFVGHACRFDLHAYHDELFARHAIAFVPQLQRAVAKRRGEYLAGRICARRALGRLGIAAGTIAIGPDREPLWPPGAIASISHAGDRALCIASSDAEVIGLGVDIERGIGPELAEQIRGVVVDADEEALIRAGFEDFPFGLAAAFSAKESLYKALFPQVRRFFGFEAMRLIRVEPRGLVFAAAQTLAPGVRAGQRFAVDCHGEDGGVRSIACILRSAD
ncbi:4'-phosphopantetheinyl transferase family protein [Pseudomonas sp. CGJS7]|uniref:4'-phosphopantetheinyl transferase family protein n=1 Tax=Pseudomonas sp. CGJS7 TaxID=3109348 RepID=UPI0030098B12